MKILHTSEATGLSLIIEDDGKNFVVGKVVHGESKGKPTTRMDSPAYHSSLCAALEDMAHKEAHSGCTSLKSYIDIHRQSLDFFRGVIKEALGA